MRVIDAFDEPVRAVAVSPDGRFLAAATPHALAVCDWVSGAVRFRVPLSRPVPQLAFSIDGNELFFAMGSVQRVDTRRGSVAALRGTLQPFSGGVAVSPDGKTLVATYAGSRQHADLERWELPALRLSAGFTFWSPFRRLGFSPNGEYLAGIDADTFELRIAVSGGLNGRDRVRYVGEGFFAFARDSQSVVFGWETDLHVMETQNGAVLRRRVTSPGDPFT